MRYDWVRATRRWIDLDVVQIDTGEEQYVIEKCLLIVFMLGIGFINYVQAIRFYNHCTFALPSANERLTPVIAEVLWRASLHQTLGQRSLYVVWPVLFSFAGKARSTFRIAA